MIADRFSLRFKELMAQSDALPINQRDGNNWCPALEWNKWGTSCQNLIRAVFTENSPHYNNFAKALAQCNGHEDGIHALQGVFHSAKEDYEGGYVFNIELLISGEIFGDFLILAKQSLSEGHKNVAAVLASAALEDALKRFAIANGLTVDNNPSMQEVINLLKSKRLVSGVQKKLLDTMPQIRNQAMHADWENLTLPDVNSVISLAEQFLVSHFSQG